MDGVGTYREAHCTGNTAWVILVVHQLDDKHALLDAVHAQRFFGCFSNDDFIRLTVDHDLPLARAYWFAAVFQCWQPFFQGVSAVMTHACRVSFPDRQTPFF